MPDFTPMTTKERIAALLDPRPLHTQPRVQEMLRQRGREDLIPTKPPTLTVIAGGKNA